MDSLDFFRMINPLPDRDDGNAILERAMQYMRTNATPDRVFERERLALWATQNGYVLAEGNAETMALMKGLRSVVPAGTKLGRQVEEWIHARGGWTT